MTSGSSKQTCQFHGEYVATAPHAGCPGCALETELHRVKPGEHRQLSVREKRDYVTQAILSKMQSERLAVQSSARSFESRNAVTARVENRHEQVMEWFMGLVGE